MMHGISTRVLLDQYDVSAYFNQADAAQAIDAAECTGFGAGDKAYVVGTRGGTVSLGGFGHFGTDELDQILAATLGNDAGALLLLAREGWVVGKHAQIAKIKSTSYELASAIADAVKASAQATCDGGLETGKLLHQLTAETGTGNYASHDNGASSANGLVAHLHVTTFTGTTATVKVQHSVDDSVWVDLITFSAVTGLGAQRQTVTGTVNRYLRAQIASATITSMTFAVGAARR